MAAQAPLVADGTPLDADQFYGVDKFGNIYFEKDMILHKEGPLGSFVFRDYQLGPVRSADIINPLNVVVFYQESNTVVFLDNRLNEINRINFNETPRFSLLSAARNAGNNQLWIFDLNTQQLELYNYRNGRRTLISQPLTQEVLDVQGDFNYCYLLTPSAIEQYNIYGSFLWETPLSGAHALTLSNNLLTAVVNGGLLAVDTETGELGRPLETNGIKLPEKGPPNLQLTQDFLYLYDGKELRSIPLTNPKE